MEYFSGPEIPVDVEFFKDDNDMDEYMKHLHYDLGDSNVA